MANNYLQFSEQIEDLSDEALEWCKKVLEMDAGYPEGMEALEKELSLKEDHGIEMEGCWPCFGWKIEEKGLWLYSEEMADLDQLEVFVRELICRFMPDYIFTLTTAEYCSKLRLQEFGGSWMVISKEGVEGGNTWYGAEETARLIRKKRSEM